MSEREEMPVGWPEAACRHHVYLSYAYLNARDYDAFASVLDEDVTVSVPGETPARGRTAVIAAESRRKFRYALEDLWACGGRVVTTGVLYQEDEEKGSEQGVDFADVFRMSAHGLIAARRTYVAASPGEGASVSG